MLILTRKAGESLKFFKDVGYEEIELEINVLSLGAHYVKIGIEAKQEYTVLRNEVYDRCKNFKRGKKSVKGNK